MDKVIIDGVDVSECKYYDDGTCCDKDVMSLSCENTDCIYKQLQRLQAENKKLKYYLNKIREDELNSMDVEWDEYITECTSTEYTNVITFVELALGERDE